MALPIKSHLKARIAAMFAGFVGGFLAFALLVFGAKVNFALTAVAFFGMIFGGAYLAQLLYAYAYPATCPACGAAGAVAEAGRPLIYACRACGAATDVQQIQIIGQEAIAQARTEMAAQEKTTSWLPWIFLVVGVGLIGGAVWLAIDSVHLLREGVSTEAKVIRVTSAPGRDKDGNNETHYTAIIEYRVGSANQVLTRGWSVKEGGSCMWPCYHQGEALKVIYLPSQPSIAKVHTLAELFFVSALLGTIGLMFTAFGVLFVRSRRQRPRQPA